MLKGLIYSINQTLLILKPCRTNDFSPCSSDLHQKKNVQNPISGEKKEKEKLCVMCQQNEEPLTLKPALPSVQISVMEIYANLGISRLC